MNDIKKQWILEDLDICNKWLKENPKKWWNFLIDPGHGLVTEKRDELLELLKND